MLGSACRTEIFFYPSQNHITGYQGSPYVDRFTLLYVVFNAYSVYISAPMKGTATFAP